MTVLTVLLASLTSGAAIALADVDRSPRIIRPPDDRVDYYATTAMLQGIGDSVCAQIGTDVLIDNGDGTFTDNSVTLAEERDPLCAGVRCGDQPIAANCTATLVAPDVLVTAGHCLDEGGVRTDLSTIYFVFDYAVKQEGVNPSTFNADQVYRATEIIGLSNVENTANDWALVRLDRAVTGRTPVGVRSSDSIAVGQAIVAIGFGAGLPMKFSANATVQTLVDFGFEADLDIIAGNSGGPIINAQTGLIEGVLSSDQGVDDFFQDGDCFRPIECPQDQGCDASFTLLASVMIPEFQTALQGVVGGAGDGDGNGDGATGDDADGDGVADGDDLCEATPAGAEVDGDGCELDGGDDDEFIPASACGAVGMIPFLFMLLGPALIRRHR